jgi:hypothetical protein
MRRSRSDMSAVKAKRASKSSFTVWVFPLSGALTQRGLTNARRRRGDKGHKADCGIALHLGRCFASTLPSRARGSGHGRYA